MAGRSQPHHYGDGVNDLPQATRSGEKPNSISIAVSLDMMAGVRMRIVRFLES